MTQGSSQHSDQQCYTNNQHQYGRKVLDDAINRTWYPALVYKTVIQARDSLNESTSGHT